MSWLYSRALVADGTHAGGLNRLQGERAWNLRDWYHIEMRHNYKDGQTPARARKRQFWEWLMGWPANWTALSVVETDKSRSVQQKHGDC